jgi:zeaxanthin glucosyltransferase
MDDKDYRVGLFMYPEFGAYNPTLKIASYLASRGVGVVYFGPIDFKSHIEHQGFRYHAVLEDRFPIGTFNKNSYPNSSSSYERIKHLVSLKRDMSVSFYEALLSGEIEREVSSMRIDLLMIDAMLGRLASMMSITGFPVLSLVTELVASGRYLAPYSSSLICSKEVPFLRFRILYHWFIFDMTRMAIKFMLGALLLIKDFPVVDLRAYKLKSRIRVIEKTNSLTLLKCEYGTRPKLPEIVLCSRDFEYDIAPKEKHRIYLGNCVHVNRHEESDLPWDFFSGAPVIYCSLGTHSAIYRHSAHFFKQVLLVATLNRNYQFVLNIGQGECLNDYQSVPDNVLVRKRVPQLELLKRTSVMLTNGGLGTIKECILHAVPMLILPCAFDQPGNAARVCHKMIGRREKIRNVTAEQLSSHIKVLMCDKKYKENIIELKKTIEKNDNFESLLVESMIRASDRVFS